MGRGPVGRGNEGEIGHTVEMMVDYLRVSVSMVTALPVASKTIGNTVMNNAHWGS